MVFRATARKGGVSLGGKWNSVASRRTGLNNTNRYGGAGVLGTKDSEENCWGKWLNGLGRVIKVLK